jgi:hypothetical protein
VVLHEVLTVHPIIQNLATATDYSVRDLLEAEEFFSACDCDEKAWYSRKRLDTVLSNGSRFWTRRMQTSGYQDGRPRSYLWGPWFGRMSEFFDRLRYGDAGAIVYLTCYEKEDGRPLFFTDIKWDPPYPHYIFGIRRDHLTDPGIVEQLSKIDCGKVALMIVPSMMELMIRGGFNPSTLNPNRYVIHTTGEPLLDEATSFIEAGLSVRDNMRCWDGGATFFTCQHGNKHWIDLVSQIWLEGNDLVSSDLFNSAQLFIEYHNGDRISWEREGTCACGRQIDRISFNVREQRLSVGNHLFQYRKLQMAFDAACKIAGADMMNLQVGVDENKRVATFYGQATKELPDSFEQELVECIRVTYPWLADWSVRYSRKRGKVSSYKRFPVFKEEASDLFDEL